MATEARRGQVYALFGANGATMVPLVPGGLNVGQVVSYGDMANARQSAVVVESAEEAECRPYAHGHTVIFVEDLHSSQVATADLDGPGGWHYESEEPWTLAAVADLKRRAAEMERQRTARREAAGAARAELRAKGAELVAAHRPAWAKAAIVAECRIDETEIQSDYFGHRTARVVFLAWSKHNRDLFTEMRKAAAGFGPTAHLGPGLDVWRARVVFAQDGQDGGRYFHEGETAPWHRDMFEEHGQTRTFTTEAAALAHVAAQGEPEPIHLSGGTVAAFRWDVSRESVENRQKWANGGGYFLGASGRHSGWIVRKGGYDLEEVFGRGDVAEWLK